MDIASSTNTCHDERLSGPPEIPMLPLISRDLNHHSRTVWQPAKLVTSAKCYGNKSHGKIYLIFICLNSIWFLHPQEFLKSQSPKKLSKNLDGTWCESPLCNTLFLAISHRSQVLSFHSWAAIAYSSIKASWKSICDKLLSRTLTLKLICS